MERGWFCQGRLRRNAMIFRVRSGWRIVARTTRRICFSFGGSANGIAAQIGELTPDDSPLNGSHPCFYDRIWVGIDRSMQVLKCGQSLKGQTSEHFSC
jgi:hypothetical protein